MSMDLGAIATGIATTIGTVTVSGQSVTATARLPNNVGKIALIVFPPVGELEIGMGKRRNDHYNFPVRLLLDPVDMPLRSDALYAWATALRDLVETNIDLGLATTKAELIAMRVEFDGEQYADLTGNRVEFDVVELIVRVLVYDIVATVAP